MGEWRTGLGRCNQIERIPGKTLPGVRSGLGTQPRYEALGDPRAIANIKNAVPNVGLMRLSSRQYPKVGTRQPVEDKKRGQWHERGQYSNHAKNTQPWVAVRNLRPVALPDEVLASFFHYMLSIKLLLLFFAITYQF